MMVVERLYQCLQDLPSREAEQALLAFRASAEAWDACLGMISRSQGAVPEQLTLFAAQTLHACARRVPLPKDGEIVIDEAAALTLISRQQALLTALTHLDGQGGRKTNLLCAALAALSVRNAATLRDLLHAALQQLPKLLSVQLLLAVAEECEALQSRAGSEVGACASAHHVLREELGHHVITWLAGVAATHILQPASPPPPLQHGQPEHRNTQAEQHFQPPGVAGGSGVGVGAVESPGPPSSPHPPLLQQQQWRLLSLVVRCVGAWSRLGCLYSTCCPAGAVRELLALTLRCVHPSDGAPATVRHEACEALGDVIEHGPDPLLCELHTPMVQLAAAAAAAASEAASTGAPRAPQRAGGGDANAVYDVVQLVSSYSAARLGELVAAACAADGGGAAAAVQPPSSAGPAAAADAAALVGALCRLAALPGWTEGEGEGGYPVSWPAMQVLADLALGCIAAAAAPAPAPAAGMGGDGAAAAASAEDAMQQDGGLSVAGTKTLPPAAAAPAPPPPGEGGSPFTTAAAALEHCVPDITLAPRPGLPPPLLVMYDNVLRSVLSCCVAWSLLGADANASTPAVAVMDGSGGDDDGDAVLVGLLRLPSECDEALRACLQACAGVVGQARQLETAVALLQHTAAATPVGAGAAAAATAAAAAVDGWPAAAGTAASAAASLTAALAAVSACGALPAPVSTVAAAAAAAPAAAAAAAWILLTAADHLARRRAAAGRPPALALVAPPAAAASPMGLAVTLTLKYCEALAGSCGAILQTHLLNVGMGSQLGPAAQGLAAPPGLGAQTGGGAPGGGGGSGGGDAAGEVLCRLAEPALTGLRLELTAAAAARALRALVVAARDAALPLPAPLALALVDAAHDALPYDAGPGYRAAERELVRAAVAAAAGREAAERLDLLQRLLSPAVSTITQTAVAASAAASPLSPPPPPPGTLPPPPPPSSPLDSATSRAVVSSHQDAALARQLRLFEAALAASAASPGPDPPPPPLAAVWPAATAAAVFTQQAWPPLAALLQRGAAGRFLMPLCRCLALLLRRVGGASAGVGFTAAVATGLGSENQSGGAVADPWVASVLAALAGCVGRPGAKHVCEPLVAMLEACAAACEAPPLVPSAGAGLPTVGPLQQEQQRWRQHATLVARTLYGILHGRAASELTATWRAADRDPDTAECLLRLATVAMRYGGTAAAVPYDADGVARGCAGGTELGPASAGAPGAVQGTTTFAAAVASAALRLAAASSGCDHRQVAVAALACTCVVLEAACGSWPAAAAGGPDGGGGALGRRELLAVVTQSGPLVVAGLLAALLSSSPLPRLQRVATALVLLAAAVADCYGLEQSHQNSQQQQEQQQSAAVEACGRVLGSWLAAAAAYLQLPEREGAALASSWAPLLAEAGLGTAAVAACSTGPSLPPSSAAAVSAAVFVSALAGGGASAAAARGLSRKLRRLLREFAESKLRA